jgi:hypothetical protein
MAVLGGESYAPLLASSTELPSASSQAPRAADSGADAIGGGELCEAPTAAFVRRAHEAVAPFTSAVSPPVEVQVDTRVSVAVLSKEHVVMSVSLLAHKQRRRPVNFCHGLTPPPEARAHAESHVINCAWLHSVCVS